jgi:O-antigen ligase
MALREKLDTISFRLSNQMQRRLLNFAVTIMAIGLGFSLVLSFDSPRTLLLLGVSTALVILWKPVLGLALYFVAYPLVPGEESLNPLKIAVLCLFILILSAWLINKAFHKQRLFSRPENRYLYIFFLFLCFSPLLGIENNFTLIDWARDIAPLLNFLLIPIMVDYFNKRENHWLLYLVFTLWIVSTVQNIFLLLAIYDVPFTDWVYTLPRIIPLHPSLGFALGLLMCLAKTPRWHFWLIFSIMNLAIAFLTPGRTIWITTMTILLLIAILSFHKRIWATLAMGLLVLIIGFLFFKGGSGTYVELQRERFQKLVEYQYDLSFENRIEEINQTGELFLSAPLWGVGFGYQYDFWRPFITGIGPGFLDTNYTHNDIMYIASKGGLIGLILFGLMLYGMGKKLFQRGKENQGFTESAWTTIAIVALINSLIIGLSTPVFQTRNAVFALAIILALGLGYRGAVPDQRRS